MCLYIFYIGRVKKKPHRFSAMGLGVSPHLSIRVGDWEGGGCVELNEFLIQPQARRNVSPFDSDSTVSALVLARAKGPEVADRKGLAPVFPGLTHKGHALLDAVGPDPSGIRSAHHQHTVNLGQETDPNRGASLDSGEEGGQRGPSLWSTVNPAARGQVAIPIGIGLAALEVDGHHLDDSRVGVPSESRMHDGPNVIEQTQTPAPLERATQTVKAAVLRDTIATGRDRDTSGLHPIDDMTVAVAQTSGRAAVFREATARFDFKTVSVVT